MGAKGRREDGINNILIQNQRSTNGKEEDDAVGIIRKPIRLLSAKGFKQKSSIFWVKFIEFLYSLSSVKMANLLNSPKLNKLKKFNSI